MAISKTIRTPQPFQLTISRSQMAATKTTHQIQRFPALLPRLHSQSPRRSRAAWIGLSRSYLARMAFVADSSDGRAS